MGTNETPVNKMVRLIREEAAKSGISIRNAAWIVARFNRSDALATMETIGSWPSSEPELAALQRVWPC